MSRGYQRADSLAEIIAKRLKKQRQSSAEKLSEIIKNSKLPEDDLRKEIPGQLEIGDKDGK